MPTAFTKANAGSISVEPEMASIGATNSVLSGDFKVNVDVVGISHTTWW